MTVKNYMIFQKVFLLLLFGLTTWTIKAQDTLPNRFYSKVNLLEFQAGFQKKYFDINVNYFRKGFIGGWYGGYDLGINYNTISIGPRLGLQYTCRFLSFKTDFVSGYKFKDKSFDTYFNPRIGLHIKHRLFLYYGYCLKLYKTSSNEDFKGNNFNLAYRISL